MKLTANIPLDDKKAAALDTIDRVAAERAATTLAPMWTVYTEKANLARETLEGVAPPDFLVVEAQSKNITVEDLCRAILDKAAQAKIDALQFESMRQRIKVQIREATSEQQINSLIGLFSGAQPLS